MVHSPRRDAGALSTPAPQGPLQWLGTRFCGTFDPQLWAKTCLRAFSTHQSSFQDQEPPPPPAPQPNPSQSPPPSRVEDSLLKRHKYAHPEVSTGAFIWHTRKYLPVHSFGTPGSIYRCIHLAHPEVSTGAFIWHTRKYLPVHSFGVGGTHATRRTTGPPMACMQFPCQVSKGFKLHFCEKTAGSPYVPPWLAVIGSWWRLAAVRG